MLGVERGTVRLVAHRDEWARLFETEAKRLRDEIGDRTFAIEHVGSTAIEGIPAKPIIDLLVVVDDLDERAWRRALDRCGYEFRPNDPVADRSFFAKGPVENRTHYLSVTERGSETQVEQCLFRDYLRDNPDAAAEYTRLKRELAAAYPDDRSSYTDEKSEFVQQVLRMAPRETR